MSLEFHVKDHTDIGSTQCYLGIQQMPKGYALMLNPDRTHYYYLREDGIESCIHWNKWAVYRSAIYDAKDRAGRK